MISFESLQSHADRIGVIGLGYVGLPLAVHLAKYFAVTGYDLKEQRVSELVSGYDRTLEVTRPDLADVEILFTCDPQKLSDCRLMIVAVPTPIDDHRIPDLKPLKSASLAVGRQIVPGACVVFESTVYPGATEEVCIPIIESESGLKAGRDFTFGYSPERINPGDKAHTLANVTKIVSGSDSATVNFLARVYGAVVTAGIHQASSIKVAEAAKVIENTQRDLNIALMNELAMIFNELHIDTSEVLKAAGTKWNFLPFHPGLVGGHCIGVDPYYLTFKAEATGYHPEMILAGRRINDGMGKYIAEQTVKLLIRANLQVSGTTIAILGLTFKEDVPDLRNTRVVDIISELRDYTATVVVSDPLADRKEAQQYYGIDLVDFGKIDHIDAVIVAVCHREYREAGLRKIAKLCTGGTPIVIDVKGIFDPAEAARMGIRYWRL